MEFLNYTTEDFVIDPDFRNWILEPTAESNIIWNDRISKHPEIKETVREAKRIILSTAKLEFTPPDSLENDIWRNVKSRTIHKLERGSKVIPLGPESVLGEEPEEKMNSLYRYLRIVAVIFLVIGFALICNNYFLSDSESLIAQSIWEETITKTNPKGQKSTIILPDGTKVILNSESELTYSSSYGNIDRVVKLTGEAFFDVVKDPAKPFLVGTDQLNTTALGTSFNVSAYGGENEEISLMTGRVLVELNTDRNMKQILDPGEMVTLEKDSVLIKENFDPGNKALWRNGILYLKDTPFDNTIEKIERWYAVEIRLENSPSKSLTCNGRFDNEYLTNVMTSLGHAAGFKFRIENKIVHIIF